MQPPLLHPDWWIDRTGYQIYPRSFCDSDGDGVGDIPGIISRLDYVKELGVGFIWLSPVYRSPMADNGYDISDYYDIAPEFGTLDDMDRLIREASNRDIGIVMDLVVNHTSNEHPWFLDSRSSRENDKRNFYIWRDPGPGGGPPDDRQSYFGGPAWQFAPETGMYYLALFTPEQPDLNWTNPDLREEIWYMMAWWLDRGIAGFRMDVIDHIGKDIDAGIITDGPELHTYLQEMHDRVLSGRDVLTVGESWSVSPATAKLYTGRDRRELDMMFQFAHITEHWHETHGKWRPKPFSLVAFKRVKDAWQEALTDDGWNALFLCNHDLPRSVSTYGDDGEHRVKSAKMLATALHLMKGTPFVYQGEEIGMTNADFTTIEEFRDVETLNFHAEQTARGMSEEDFLHGARSNSRDNSRTPMQWTGGAQGGFTTGTPWIGVNGNHTTINAQADRRDPDSVFHHYRKLAALRRQHPVIVHGRYAPHLRDHPQVMAYTREHDGAHVSVIANFTAESLSVEVPEAMQCDGKCLIHNDNKRDHIGATIHLHPYEAFAVLSDSNLVESQK